MGEKEKDQLGDEKREKINLILWVLVMKGDGTVRLDAR